MVECDFEEYGCNGGYLTSSTHYLIQTGVVTESCLSYSGTDSNCNYLCDNPNQEWKKYKCKLGSMKIKVNAEDIKQELYDNGPM